MASVNLFGVVVYVRSEEHIINIISLEHIFNDSTIPSYVIVKIKKEKTTLPFVKNKFKRPDKTSKTIIDFKLLNTRENFILLRNISASKVRPART